MQVIPVQHRDAVGADVNRTGPFHGLGKAPPLATISGENDYLVVGRNAKCLRIDKNILRNAIRFDSQAMAQQVARDRGRKPRLLELVGFQLAVFPVEHRDLAARVYRQQADMSELGARLSERAKLAKHFLLAPVEDGDPALHVIAEIQVSIHVGGHRGELRRLTEMRLQVLRRKARDQLALDIVYRQTRGTFQYVDVFLGVDTDVGRLLQIVGVAVAADRVKKQTLVIEHADLPVLDVTDINFFVDRNRDRAGIVEFAGVAAGLREAVE